MAGRKTALTKVRPVEGETLGIAVQPSLDGLARKDKLPTTPRVSEKVVQAQSRQIIAFQGYQSMEVGATRRAVDCHCPHCKRSFQFTPTGYQGNSLGYPDLSIYRNNHFPPVAILVEMKADKTPIRPEQQQLADLGRSIICHSPADVLRAIIAAETAMDKYRFPDERRALMEKYLADNEKVLGRR